MNSSESESRGSVVAGHALPEALVRYLDGTDLPGRAGQAFRLTTIDAGGWPRGAQLSVGEVVALGPRTLALCAWPGTATAGNLSRDGRCTLTVVLEGAVHEVRMRARAVPVPPGAPEASYFRAEVESAESHHAKYATVLSGVSYRLEDPRPVLRRWSAQVDALRRAGEGAP